MSLELPSLKGIKREILYKVNGKKDKKNLMLTMSKITGSYKTRRKNNN